MPLLTISHRQQRRQAECLAACATMVLDYLQIPSHYERLVTLLRISYAGAPFRNLRQLESLGVFVHIHKGQIGTLQTHLENNLPPIVFLATKELSYWDEATNHAVVVSGIDDTSIYIHDPYFAEGPKIISIAEFDLAWLEMDEYYALIQLR